MVEHSAGNDGNEMRHGDRGTHIQKVGGACWSMSDSAATSGSSQNVVRYAPTLTHEKSSSQRTTRLYINPYYRILLKRQNYGKLL